MKDVIPWAGWWLVGAAWLLASTAHCEFDSTYTIDPSRRLNATYPDCSVPPINPKDDPVRFPGVYYIKNQAEADGLLGCTTLRGRVEVTECDLTASEITLKELQAIKGSLRVSDCNHLQNFSASALQSVDDYLEFVRLPVITGVHLPLLRNPGASFIMKDTPFLPTVTAALNASFDTNVMVINTGLSNLDFLYSESGTQTTPKSASNSYPQSFLIYDNPHLERITGPADTYNNVSIYNNGLLTSIDFPNLRTCGPFYISSATVLGIPSLVDVEGKFSIINSSMVDLSLPKLKSIKGLLVVANNTHLKLFDSSISEIGKSIWLDYGEDALQISGNLALQAIGLKELDYIEGLLISNNPFLLAINLQGLKTAKDNTTIKNNPSLSSIDLGSLSTSQFLDISGNFSSLALPSLYGYTLYYPFLINSTNPEFDCSAIDQKFYRQSPSYWSKDDYRCGAYVAGSTKDTSRHWHPPKTGLKRPGIQAAIAIGSIVGALLFVGIFWRHWRREDQRNAERAAAVALADLPPNYARVPKPHEVPPAYVQQAAAGSAVSSLTELNTAVATPAVAAENMAAEQATATAIASLVEETTVPRVLTPPENIEGNLGREPERSEEVRTGALPSSPTSQAARVL